MQHLAVGISGMEMGLIGASQFSWSIALFLGCAGGEVSANSTSSASSKLSSLLMCVLMIFAISF